MSYSITLTSGNQLVAIPDGQIDQTATNLTLIGKNATGYGQYINENLVYLLENFANTVQPTKPVIGQLWYDTSSSQLKVYSGINGFQKAGGTIVGSSQPPMVAGDLWVNNYTSQLFFNDGTNLSLPWPIFTAQQGLSGFETSTVLDTAGTPHVIVSLYVAQTLIGVYSKTTFTPATTIPGITGNIFTGFTSSTISGMVFNQVSSKANALVAADGTLKTVGDLMLSSGNSSNIISATGSLNITNVNPLVLGPNGNFSVNVNSASGFTLQNNAVSSENFTINLETSASTPALFINSVSRRAGIYNANPQATLHIGTPGDSARPGNVIIEGNLTVNGTTTSNNTATVTLEDYTITLAKTGSPSDTTANGSGLIIAGTTNKTLLWSNTIDSANGGAFSSSENFDLAAGKYFSINGVPILSSTSLGSSVSSAAGLVSVSNLTNLTVGNLTMTSNTITSSGNTIVLNPGTGAVNLSSTPMINLAMNGSPSSTDAANVSYVQYQVKLAPLSLTIPTSGQTDTQIQAIIAKVFPKEEHVNGTICRVITPDAGITVNSWLLTAGVWTDNGSI